MTETIALSPPGKTRSRGLKLLLVGILAFLVWIPAMLIYLLVWERSTRADEVRQEIHELRGGEQDVAGPFLLLPTLVTTTFTNSDGEEKQRTDRQTFAILPETLNLDTNLDTEVLHRSLYEATVYQADIAATGRFAPPVLPGEADPMEPLWTEAVIAVRLTGNSPMRGIKGKPVLRINGTALTPESLQPGILLRYGSPARLETARSNGFTFAIPDPETAAEGFDFALDLTLTGGGSFTLSALGNDTTAQLAADWPHPGFAGDFIPDNRRVGETGFTADWAISGLARNLPQAFSINGDLDYVAGNQDMTVNLVTPGSPYQKVNRSLKYALLFMGLVFLTVFLLEILFNARIHPAQYLLIGMAQIVFYLLVLAVSEHLGFDRAFFGAAGVTVLLSGYYAAQIFRKFTAGILSLLAFAAVYSLIWMLMASEDFALLIGASAAFTAIAITMFATRDVDWYGDMKTEKPKQAV